MRTGIYSIVNKVNGKQYIGSAKDFARRWAVHRYTLRNGKHHSVLLQRAWNKYGEEHFIFQKVLICSEENLLMYEQRLLDGLDHAYNIAPIAGSSLGRRTSEETKAKLSIAITGKKRSEETKALMSSSAKKVIRGPLSEQTRRKLSASLRGRKMPTRTIEHSRNLAQAKRKLTDEQIREMRAFLSLGRTQISIASQFSCSAVLVCNIASGKSHSGVI